MKPGSDIQDLFSKKEGITNNRHIYTVSEITQDIKVILESNFREIWVEGEVSNFRPSAAGHYYFSLKDQTSVLTAVLFNRTARDTKFKIEDGLKVICYGSIDVYPPRGQYQLVIEKIEPKGIGSLQLALEQLKQKLEKEGLFSPAHKRRIPYLPSRIAVVTSLQGAAIKDIFKVLDRRFKDVHIIVNPVRVQGEGAGQEIAMAIEDLNYFNQLVPVEKRIEVMIVGRGGGSIEDLWAFNEEVVARAIYNSRIPVISAVGHERDVTIADLVADLRAPTPSVAAELVLPEKEELTSRLEEATRDLKMALTDIALGFEETLNNLIHRLILNIKHSWDINAGNLNAVSKKLHLLNPSVKIQQYKERVRDFSNQIYVRMAHFLKLQEAEFTKAIEKLSSLSPLNILARGYSITFKMPEEKVIKDATSVKSGDTIKTRLNKGEILSEVRVVR